jgi:LysM repeat protein
VKKFITAFFFVLVFIQSGKATGDSTHILTYNDTLFVQSDSIIGSYFIHKVEPRQTLFSLARFYKLKQADLAEFNPALQVRLPQIGDELRIPISRKFVRVSTPPTKRESYTPVIYRVLAGEGIYTIARKNFNLDPATIIKLNKLEGNTIYPNQLLILGWVPISAFTSDKASIAQKTNNQLVADKIRKKEVASITNDNNKARFEESDKKFFKRNERGVGFWHRELKDSKGMYVLNDSAVPGSIISITNPMYNNTVYAKVVGPIPANVYPPDVMIIVSPEVAQKLGVRDERFFAQINYYSR